MGDNAWEIFKPYLSIERFRKGLQDVVTFEREIAGVKLFSTLNMLLEARELDWLHSPRNTTTLDKLNERTRLIDVVPSHDHSFEFCIIYTHRMRLDRNVGSCVGLYRATIESITNFGDYKFVERDQELALRVNLVDLIKFIVMYHMGGDVQLSG